LQPVKIKSENLSLFIKGSMEDNTKNVEQEVTSTVPENLLIDAVEEVPTKSKKNKTEEKPEHRNYQSRLGKCLVKNNAPAKVLEVIYWQQVHKTAGIFGGVMFLLITLYCYPFLTVLTTFCMALLAVAFLYRIGMTIVNAVQKTSPEHPFQKLLERDIKVPTDRIDSISKFLAGEINCTIKCLQDLFLVKDVLQSLKFGVFLWLLSYVATWISPLTILTLSVLLVFTVPKLYEEKSVQIDDAIKSVSVAIASIMDALKQKLPARVLKFLNVTEEKKNE